MQTDDGNATALRVFDPDSLIVNASVWESLEALRGFVYGDPAADRTILFPAAF